MKVEQRIGQMYHFIRVVNFAYEDTVEADVYFALGRRINLFHGIISKHQPILSRLPKEFEKLALERPKQREAARQRFLADVGGMVERAGEAGFDVDEVADEAIDVPDLPGPSLSLSDLDAALRLPGVLPPGAELSPLDPGSYKLRLPGAASPFRVTTSADVFDDHFESHEFLSPGGPLFETLAGPTLEVASASDTAVGHCWLVEEGGGGACEMFVLTPEGPTRVDTLGDLLDGLNQLPPLGYSKVPPQRATSVIRCLA
jgi:hypothetical protein